MSSKKNTREIYKDIAERVNAGKSEEALGIIQKDLLLQNDGLKLLEKVAEEAFNDKNFKLHVIMAQQYKNALAREIQLSGQNTDTDC